MFTGIVEEMGTIQKIERGSQSAVLSIRCEKVLEGTQIGDSIAVNGVCLTVTSLRSDGYDADVMAETMNRSSLGLLQPGSRVNLERAMPADGSRTVPRIPAIRHNPAPLQSSSHGPG